MSKYRVWYTTPVSQWVDIEADSPEEAEDAAWRELEPVPWLGHRMDAGGDWEVESAPDLLPDDHEIDNNRTGF